MSDRYFIQGKKPTCMMILDGVELETIVTVAPIVADAGIAFNKQGRNTHLLETRGGVDSALSPAHWKKRLNYQQDKET